MGKNYRSLFVYCLVFLLSFGFFVQQALAELSFAGEVVFYPALSYSIKLLGIDSTKFVLAFSDSNGIGKTRVGIVDGTSLTAWGAVTDFNVGTTGGTSLAKLDSNHFVLAFRDGGAGLIGRAVIGTISGTTITYGSKVTFDSGALGGDQEIAIDVIDSTHFIIAYNDDNTSSDGFVIVGETNGSDTITGFGSRVAFDTNSVKNVDVKYITTFDTDDYIALAYHNGTSAFVTMVTVDGTTVNSTGTPQVFNASTNTDFIKIARLDDARFAMVYTSYEGDGKGKAVVVKQSGGNIISTGAGSTFATPNADWTDVDPFDSSTIVIGYRDNSNSGYGTALVANIDGSNNLTYETPVVFNQSGSVNISMLVIDGYHVIPAYRDLGNSFYGMINIGLESGFGPSVPEFSSKLAAVIIGASALGLFGLIVLFRGRKKKRA